MQATADRKTITIVIQRKDLEAKGAAGDAVLSAFQSRNDGDWGGPDFPAYDLSKAAEDAVLRALVIPGSLTDRS